MKNQRKSGILNLLFLLVISLAASNSFAKETLRVAYQDNDGSPLIMGGGRDFSNPPGMAVDILKQVAKDLNIELILTREPNKRVHDNLTKGTYDGSGTYSFKESRTKEGVYPMKNGELDKERRVYIQGYYMYALKGSKVTWDGEKISGATAVGANSGYSVVGNLNKLGINVQEAKTIKQNLQKLLSGRIQAYAAQDAALDPIIASYPEYKDIVKVGPAIKRKEYYFMFSHQYYKKNKEMAEKIWDQTAKVRDGVIEKYKAMKIKPILK